MRTTADLAPHDGEGGSASLRAVDAPRERCQPPGPTARGRVASFHRPDSVRVHGAGEGLDVGQMLDVLARSPTANSWFRGKLSALKGENAATSLDIKGLRKDILYAVATGAEAGIPMPLAASIATVLSAAAAAGEGASDLAQLPRIFRSRLAETS